MATTKRTRGSTNIEPATAERGSVSKRQKSISTPKQPSASKSKARKVARGDHLIGLLSKQDARARWPSRYQPKESNSNGNCSDGDDEEILNVKAHYTQAEIAGVVYNLGDCVFVQAEQENPSYIGKIVELFETDEGKLYFTSQWFFRAEDTVIKSQAGFHDKKRVFLSDIKDDNLLDCIVSKITVVQVPPVVGLETRHRSIPPCDFYYDMGYSLPYSTFYTLPADNAATSSDSTSTVCNEDTPTELNGVPESKAGSEKNQGVKSEIALLDLYSGCGGMSTGLCFGANLSGVNLVTKWALDNNVHACKSLKRNHPETEVRNEEAESFLNLLKEWQKLCQKYCTPEEPKSSNRSSVRNSVKDRLNKKEEFDNVSEEEFEVEKMVGIRYEKPTGNFYSGVQFKVHWKGYGESEDSWEPVESLGDCEDCVKEFVKNGAKAKILPLPGDVDVICGGPPCQGASGYNRFRNAARPLDDPKNHQMVVFMDIVKFLGPKYVLMENVVDILKFAGGFLGRYALSRLVDMNYQARLGMMAAGCYGLPQFRMRVFLWGAKPYEKLPQYALPTHDAVLRGVFPNEWEHNVVAYDENHNRKLEKALVLGDAISDLPSVANDETRDEMGYKRPPCNDFQRYIRLPKEVMMGQLLAPTTKKAPRKAVVYDHRPLLLNKDDFQRVCKIPKRKGANFRDLSGVIVKEDNTVGLDTSVDRSMLPSGKPLVPDYAMTYCSGRSLKPFGRLWWDETVPTVVTRAEPHNQVILHPMQDRVLSIRENARLQGFPDYYRLYGPIKERYIQVGNAVAGPVARALGFSLGFAMQNLSGDGPLMELPPKFPHGLNRQNRDVSLDVGEQC